jgi:glucan biosynthesis protein C
MLKVMIPPNVLEVGNGGWGFLYYLWFLVAGFMIVSSDRLQQHIMHQRWISLFLGLVLSTARLVQLFSPSRLVFPVLISDWLYALLIFFSAWSWLFAILGFGMKLLNFDRPLLRYANEAVLPFFILHQTVLLCVGYFVMAWKVHDTVKWVITFSSSFIIVIMIYMLLVRKAELLRFLFGMKTTHPFFDIFRKKSVVIILLVLYVSLIGFAAAGASRSRSAMPLTFDPERDTILNSESITDQSPIGVRVVNDEAASIGKAVEFFSGANAQAESEPTVYVEMRFSAPAGLYFIWLRGRTDINSGYTDSVWAQVDDQIGTRTKRIRLGNWLDVHPVGVYGWASDADHPITVVLKHSGNHTIRIQPRQTPHRIDQIWLSRFQHRIPDTLAPVK